MICSIATKVNENGVDQIKHLEKELGRTLLAFRCHELKPSQLSAEELNKIQEVEKNLGVSLIAVDG
jgi:hypothetical protein